MERSERPLTRAVGAVSAAAPVIAGRVAVPVFLHVGRRMPMAADDEPMMLRARRWEAALPGMRGRGARMLVHEWGTGPDVVLLVHGWRGRASQFAPLVRELVAERFRVVAVDLPAHGDAPGRGTYLGDWIDAIGAVQAHHGALHAVVGHSLGGLASLVAVAEGVQARRVVTASAPADAEGVFEAFRDGVGLSPAAVAAMRARLATRYFAGADPAERFSGVRHPLPPTVPALVVHDTGDRVIPHRAAERLRAAMPSVARVDTHGGWHARLVRSDAFLDAAVTHLTAVDPVQARSGLVAVQGAGRSR